MYESKINIKDYYYIEDGKEKFNLEEYNNDRNKEQIERLEEETILKNRVPSLQILMSNISFEKKPIDSNYSVFGHFEINEKGKNEFKFGFKEESIFVTVDKNGNKVLPDGVVVRNNLCGFYDEDGMWHHGNIDNKSKYYFDYKGEKQLKEIKYEIIDEKGTKQYPNGIVIYRDKWTIARVRSNMTQQCLTLKEISEKVGEGKNFIGVKFIDGFKEQTIQNVEHVSFITFDIDNGLWTLKMLKGFLQSNKIMPNLIFKTFSNSSTCPKFRLMWAVGEGEIEATTGISKVIYLLLDKAIRAKILAKEVKGKLPSKLEVISDDISSCQISHMMSGTNQEVYITNDSYVDINNFFITLSKFYDDKKHKYDFYTDLNKICGVSCVISDIKDITENTKVVGVIKQKLSKVDENDKDSYRTYQVYGPAKKEERKKARASSNVDLTGTSDIQLLRKRCRLFEEIENGTETLGFEGRNWFLKNMANIQGGLEKAEEIFENLGTDYEKHKIKYYRDNGTPVCFCNGQGLYYSCKYCDTCKYGKGSMAFTAQEKSYQSKLENKVEVKTHSLKESEEMLSDSFKSVLQPLRKIVQNKVEIKELQKNKEISNFKKLKKMSSLEKENMVLKESSSSVVSIIKSSTGVGKTKTLIDLIISEIENYKFAKSQYLNPDDCKNFVLGMMYCAKEHRKAEEFFQDLMKEIETKNYEIEAKELGIVYVTKRPEALDSKTEEEFQEVESLGLSVIERIRELINDIEEMNVTLDDDQKNWISQAKLYIKTREDSQNAKIVITTHDYSSVVDLNKYQMINTVIFDEDITSKMYQFPEIKLNTLLMLKKSYSELDYVSNEKVYGYEDLVKICESIKEKVEDEDSLNKTMVYPFDVDEMLWTEGSTEKSTKQGMSNQKLKRLIKAKYEDVNKNKLNYTLLLDVKSLIIKNSEIYLNKIRQIKNVSKKIIILSATPSSEEMISKIFPDVKSIEILDNGWTELKGNLWQYSDDSMSRNMMKTSPDKLNKIKEILNNYKSIEDVITYMSSSKEFSNYKTSMHFGALAGLNELSGKDIAIVGTYICNPIQANLISASLRNDKKPFELQLPKFHKIYFNGIEQKFMKYEDKIMQNYNMWFSWNELEQAIGRARLTRTRANVVVFSNLIHPLATQLKKNEIADFESEIEIETEETDYEYKPMPF